MRPNESGTTRVSMSRTIASLNDLRIFVTRSSADSITFDTIRKRSKPCFIPFFKMDVELFMRTYIPPQIQHLAVSQQLSQGSAHRYENRLVRVSESRPTCGHSETCASSHSEALLRHSSTRSRHRSPRHSAPTRSSRPERNDRLLASLATPSERNSKSFGLATTERQATRREVDEPAASGGGRYHPRCGRGFHRTKSPPALLEACQGAARH